MIGGVCASFLLLATGFLFCVIPQTTTSLASRTSSPDIRTAFTVDDLVAVADATRDYSFCSHDRASLMLSIFNANENANQRASAEGAVLAGAPKTDGVDSRDPAQVEAALEGASERYAYSEDAIAHLDDCFSVAARAYALIVGGLVVSVASLAATRSRKAIGQALCAAGIFVLAFFCVAGTWALLDFDGMFTLLHQMLFAKGNWTFASDSLLIRALPTGFWMGMGAIWITASAIASILSILVGKSLATKTTKPRELKDLEEPRDLKDPKEPAVSTT